MLSAAGQWAAIDYRSVTEPRLQGNVELHITKGGVAHGLAVWFDGCLVDGVTLSNAPDRPEHVYGTPFFPWPERKAVETGDTVRVTFDVRKVGREYIWNWNSEVVSAGGARKASFRQSSFNSQPVPQDRLTKAHSEYVPVLNTEGEIERMILTSIDGTVSNATIARAVAERFRGNFGTVEQAIAAVGDVAQRFGATSH